MAKKLYRISTHLGIEYRHARSPRQAMYLVYLAYRQAGYRRLFVDAAQDWDASEV